MTENLSLKALIESEKLIKADLQKRAEKNEKELLNSKKQSSDLFNINTQENERMKCSLSEQSQILDGLKKQIKELENKLQLSEQDNEKLKQENHKLFLDFKIE